MPRPWQRVLCSVKAGLSLYLPVGCAPRVPARVSQPPLRWYQDLAAHRWANISPAPAAPSSLSTPLLQAHYLQGCHMG